MFLGGLTPLHHLSTGGRTPQNTHFVRVYGAGLGSNQGPYGCDGALPGPLRLRLKLVNSFWWG